MEAISEEYKLRKLIDIDRKNNQNKIKIIYKIDRGKKFIKLYLEEILL